MYNTITFQCITIYKQRVRDAKVVNVGFPLWFSIRPISVVRCLGCSIKDNMLSDSVVLAARQRQTVTDDPATRYLRLLHLEPMCTFPFSQKNRSESM